ncbi:MAG: hypothetical protein PWQ42_647, partial [Sulfurospirillum sp.]|nr:hypothetical protein [Sulfurospirillum sp.]
MKANIYIGSTCKEKKEYIKVFNPYTKEIVSRYALCDA